MAGNIKLSAEKRKALEDKLADMHDASVRERSDLLPRWRKQRDQYDNKAVPFVAYIMKGVKDKCWPYSQPLLDTLGDNVMQAIFSQDPHVGVSNNGGRRQDTKACEDIIKFFVKGGGLESAVRSILDDVGTTNHGNIRMTLDTERMMFVFEPVPPDDLLVLGAACYNLETADMAGHSFFPTIGEVKDRIAAKAYYEPPVGYEPRKVEEEAQEDDATLAGASESADIESQPTRIECMSVTCDFANLGKEPGASRAKPKVETYIVHYDHSARVLMSCRPAMSTRHWYFSFGYLPRPTRGFWSDKSVGRNLQDLHDTYQMAWNMFLYGHLWSAFKPIVNRGPFNKAQSIAPGGIINTLGSEVTIPLLDYDPKQMPFIIQGIERCGEGTIRISQAGMAKPSAAAKTATQVEEEAQGQATGRSGYVATFSETLCEIGKEILLCVSALWKEFKEAHGDALPDWQPTEVDSIMAGPMPTMGAGTGEPGMGQMPSPMGMTPPMGMPPMMSIPGAMPPAGEQAPPPGVWPFGDVRSMDIDVTGSSPSMNASFQYSRGMALLQLAPQFPELNRMELLQTVVGALQLRNSSRLIYTPDQMMAMQQRQQMAQLQQGIAAGMAGGAVAPGAAGAAGEAPPADGGDPFEGMDDEQVGGMVSGLLGGAGGG